MQQPNKEQQILSCKQLMEASEHLKEAFIKFRTALGYDIDYALDFEELMIEDYGDYYEAIAKSERIKPTRIDEQMWVTYNHFLAMLDKNVKLKNEQFFELTTNTKL